MSANDLINSFLNVVNETSEFETERQLLPKDFECNGSIVKYQLNAGTAKSADGSEERPWCSVTFEWELDSPDLREQMGRDKVVGFGRPLYLNFLPTGGLHPRENVELAKMAMLSSINMGKLTVREILDSFIGQYLKVRILHRSYKNKSNEDVTSANIVCIGEAD